MFNALEAGSFVLFLYCGWLVAGGVWRLVCVAIGGDCGVCVGCGGYAVGVPMVHLHRFTVFLFNCIVHRDVLF